MFVSFWWEPRENQDEKFSIATNKIRLNWNSSRNRISNSNRAASLVVENMWWEQSRKQQWNEGIQNMIRICASSFSLCLQSFARTFFFIPFAFLPFRFLSLHFLDALLFIFFFVYEISMSNTHIHFHHFGAICTLLLPVYI